MKGFSALFEVLDLSDVLQLIHQTRRTATVRVAGEGSLDFTDGELTFAEAGALQGNPALQVLLDLPNGQVTVHGGLRRSPNVQGSFQAVLLEALRRLDEQRAVGDGEPTAPAEPRPRRLPVHSARSAGTGAFDFHAAEGHASVDVGPGPPVPRSDPPRPARYRLAELPAPAVEVHPAPPPEVHQRADVGMLVALAVSCMLLGVLLAVAVLDVQVA